MENNTNCNSQDLKSMETKGTNNKCKVDRKNIDTSTEPACKIQIPTMCTNSNLCSQSDCEQHNVNNNHGEANEEKHFTHKSNEPSESHAKLQTSSSNNSIQEIQQETLSNINLPRKKLELLELIHMLDTSSFSYKSDFINQCLMKYNCEDAPSPFKETTSIFKDENSPNLLSTTASSLSSLTIDDDYYNDNSKPNKAGLVSKTKLNKADLSQENLRRDPIGSASEPLQNSKLIENKQIIDNRSDNFVQNSLANEEIPQQKLNSYSHEDSYQQQKDHKQKLNSYSHEGSFQQQKDHKQKLNSYSHEDSYQQQKDHKQRLNSYSCENSYQQQMDHKQRLDSYSYENSYLHQEDHQQRNMCTGCNTNKMKNQHQKNMHYTCSEVESRRMESHSRNKFHVQNSYKDKPQHIDQENQMYMNYHRDELDFVNKYDKSIKHNRYKEQEYLEENRCPFECYQSNKINHSIEERNELNAYEEQLLDQCIRRGMAKVTKRNMNDIKPFCWDLHQICLTTRAMLKNHDENILREKQEEYNRRHSLHRGFTRCGNNLYSK